MMDTLIFFEWLLYVLATGAIILGLGAVVGGLIAIIMLHERGRP